MSDFPETSHSLIARVKDMADGAAWTEFLGIYRPVVYRLARKRGMQDSKPVCPRSDGALRGRSHSRLVPCVAMAPTGVHHAACRRIRA